MLPQRHRITPVCPALPPLGHHAYIRGIGNYLPQKYFLVGVERVDYQGHKLGNLCLEGKGFHLLFAMLDFFRHLEDKI